MTPRSMEELEEPTMGSHLSSSNDLQYTGEPQVLKTYDLLDYEPPERHL